MVFMVSERLLKSRAPDCFTLYAFLVAWEWGGYCPFCLPYTIVQLGSIFPSVFTMTRPNTNRKSAFPKTRKMSNLKTNS